MRISDWSSDVCSSDLAPIADFGFNAERAEIVTDRTIDIVTVITVDHGRLRGLSDVEFNVFDDHRAAFDADIPRLVAGQRRRGKNGRSECQCDGKLPHHNPLSWLSLRTAPTPYSGDEHTSELQSLMRISYAVFCLKKKN